MRQFYVDSIKRLYQNNLVSEEKINSLVLNGKLTIEEKEYILAH